ETGLGTGWRTIPSPLYIPTPHPTPATTPARKTPPPMPIERPPCVGASPSPTLARAPVVLRFSPWSRSDAARQSPPGRSPAALPRVGRAEGGRMTTAPRKRILVVDDEPLIIEVLSEHFKPTYDIETALNGTDALTAVLRGRPDVVLLDINMPRMNGVEVLKDIKK